VRAKGKDESPYRAAFAQIIITAETDKEAEELYAEHILYFFNRCLHVYPGFADAPGYRTIKTIQAGKLDQLRAENQKIFQSLTWKDLVDGGFVIAGSPETVRERMKEMIHSLRVGTIFGLFHMGDMPDWKTRRSTQLFAEQVMPYLRDEWPEWKDDSRWWCHPYEGRVRPEEGLAAGARNGAVNGQSAQAAEAVTAR
jgi:alkanesulfonate monooxygenase SsuD/methylene tetrahydromethanopterin reductase-like flavin-dependent oxidoreductase (luciferase family)